jgi:protein-disulfide isomerase
MAAVAPRVFAADTLFTYKGKTYEPKDLTPAMQSTLHDLRMENYLRMQAFADETVYQDYIADGAKKAGKPEKDFEDSLFKVSEPSDKEVADWFEGNKGRLPPNYTLDQIKGDIKTLLKGESKKKQREDLLAKLKKDGGFTLAVGEPVPPEFKIDAEGYPTKGPQAAKVRIIEFADFQCPHCKHAVDLLDKALKKYDGKVSLTYLDFPIKGEVSNQLAYGAFCADKQGKYWEFHKLAFDKQGTLNKDSSKDLAKELKLDEAKFADCLKSGEAEKRVAKSRAEGERIGITGTPGLFVNGRRVALHEDDDLYKEIDRALKGGAS